MVHKAGDLVRINPEYYAKNKYQLFASIRDRGPDYIYTVEHADELGLYLVEGGSWANSLQYLVPAFEEDEETGVDLSNLL